jgi:predicted site-specific integrase-resolvase
MEEYLLLEEAARRYQINREMLKYLAEAGKIRAVKVNGNIAMAEVDIMNLLASGEIDPDLVGHPIRLSEASEKYNIPSGTLTRWAYAGRVRIIRRGPKLLELDEADVKHAARVFKEAREKTGSYVRAGWVLKRLKSTKG